MNGNPKGRRGLCRFLFLTFLLGIAGFTLFFLWRDGAFLPRWIVWKEGSFTDASGQYTVLVADRNAKAVFDGQVIWETERGIKVQDALSCDTDGDGQDELVLLCWRIGRFGSARPFWVKQDEKKWSQHIFVYRLDNGQITPKWMASDIGTKAVSMTASRRRSQSDFDRENPAALGSRTQVRPDLRQRLLLTAPDGTSSSWLWDSWGFSKEDTDITFAAFGDNLIHEPIFRYGLTNQRGFDFLYDDLKDTIAQADVAVINQETPLTTDPSCYSGYPRFGTPADVGEALVRAGFHVVTCATNHAVDQGVDGIDFTRTFFQSRGLVCVGTQTKAETGYRPYEVIARGGLRFALLAYTYGTNGLMVPAGRSCMIHTLDDEARVREDIALARKETDFVIVFVHWGTENAAQPDAFQEKWTDIFLESHADVVIGTHPHTLQPCEMLTGSDGHRMLVYYSLGNYVSAQPEKVCTKGGMARFTVSLTPNGCEVTEYALIPLLITRGEEGRYTVGMAEP